MTVLRTTTNGHESAAHNSNYVQRRRSVEIPAHLTRAVLDACKRDWVHQARVNAVSLGPAALALLADLYAAAYPAGERDVDQDHTDPAGSAAGTSPGEWVTVNQAAERLECSTAYVRRLARRGAITAERAGPVWLIHAPDLDRYRTGVRHR